MGDPFDPFETEDEEWVIIQDASGKKASMRHLATVSIGGKTYFVLGAMSEDEHGEFQRGLLLVREDTTVDGTQEYVIASDEKEIEHVVGNFVAHALEHVLDGMEDSGDDDCACGVTHLPGEFCYCGNEAYLQ